jgi:hypothetical protein
MLQIPSFAAIPKKQYTFTGTQYFTTKEVEVYAVTEINV